MTCFFFLDILYQCYACTVSVQYMPSFLSLYIYWYRRSAKNCGTGIRCGYMKKFLILNFNEGHEIPVHLRPILHFVMKWCCLTFSCCNKINYYFVAVEFVLCLDQNGINFWTKVMRHATQWINTIWVSKEQEFFIVHHLYGKILKFEL